MLGYQVLGLSLLSPSFFWLSRETDSHTLHLLCLITYMTGKQVLVSPFLNENAEAQKEYVTYPRSHS